VVQGIAEEQGIEHLEPGRDQDHECHTEHTPGDYPAGRNEKQGHARHESARDKGRAAAQPHAQGRFREAPDGSQGDGDTKKGFRGRLIHVVLLEG